MSDLEQAKDRFQDLNTAVRSVTVVTPDDERLTEYDEVLRVSFDGRPYSYSNQVNEITGDLGLKTVLNETNSDGMPILYFGSNGE